MRRFWLSKVLVLAALICVSAVLSTGASGAPVNEWTQSFTFTCDHGFGELTAIGTTQAQNTTGHVISPDALAGSIYQVKMITIDGQVVRNIADFGSRDLVNCTLIAINGEPFTSDVVVFSGFFTPAN
jgi:hypothetical protein